METCIKMKRDPYRMLRKVQGGSSNPTSGYILKRTENSFLKKYLYTHVHSSIIYNSQKQLPRTDEEINKMWYRQLTLKHHGFELHKSTYTWNFFFLKEIFQYYVICSCVTPQIQRTCRYGGLALRYTWILNFVAGWRS